MTVFNMRLLIIPTTPFSMLTPFTHPAFVKEDVHGQD